ncbi:hypothetical protein HON52_03530 [Candidatus Uhrbacteria bacterium]|jgi:hypothetical protein|nr:hypothetical protein [Candidatus Uhrbacteria bacterium]
MEVGVYKLSFEGIRYNFVPDRTTVPVFLVGLPSGKVVQVKNIGHSVGSVIACLTTYGGEPQCVANIAVYMTSFEFDGKRYTVNAWLVKLCNGRISIKGVGVVVVTEWASRHRMDIKSVKLENS